MQLIVESAKGRVWRDGMLSEINCVSAWLKLMMRGVAANDVQFDKLQHVCMLHDCFPRGISSHKQLVEITLAAAGMNYTDTLW